MVSTSYCMIPFALPDLYQNLSRYTIATMATTILLTMFATLAQASLTPLLPPIVVRDTLQNSTTNVTAGQNTTYPGAQSTRNYDTAAYKVYIAVMVFGTVSAALMLPIVYSPDVLYWWRQKKHKKAVEQRKEDVAEATARMRQEMTQPQEAHVRPERPGSNWI
jgi:hypothetical protein